MFSKDSEGKLLEYVINLTAARVLVPVIQIMNTNYSEDSSHTRIRHSRSEQISEENSEMKPSTDLLPTSKEHQKTFTKKITAHNLFITIIHFQRTNTWHPKTAQTGFGDSSRATGRTVTPVSAPQNNLLAFWYFVQHSLYYPVFQPATHFIHSPLSLSFHSQGSTEKINSDLISMYSMPLCTAVWML